MSLIHFCASSCHFRDITFYIFDLQKVGHGKGRQIAPFDGKCHYLQMSPHCFCAKRYNILKLFPPKSRPRSQSAIFSITPFDGKCQNPQMSPTNFCDSSYHSRYKMLIWFTSKK